MSSRKRERKFPDNFTSFLARIVKKSIFLNAQTTANVKNRQERVLKSKYPTYSLSGGTKKQVIKAATAAMQKTTFFFINRNAFKLSPKFLLFTTRIIL